MAMKAKHAFGNLADVENALKSGKINNYDILFLDGDTEPKIGWIDSKGIFRLVENEVEVDVGYEISYKPDGTLVDYRDKEIRVMIPADTKFELQNSGDGADTNSYYIGFKAYAPNDEVVGFKEDLAEVITDSTMYSFENNDFAGIDENGRKYSIVWLPVAKYDNSVWTYHGANSSKTKYIGWHYSVEWYDVNGKIIASDCIRINLSNEGCHSSVKPYYVGEIIKNVETMFEEKVAEVESAYEITEF